MNVPVGEPLDEGAANGDASRLGRTGDESAAPRDGPTTGSGSADVGAVGVVWAAEADPSAADSESADSHSGAVNSATTDNAAAARQVAPSPPPQHPGRSPVSRRTLDAIFGDVLPDVTRDELEDRAESAGRDSNQDRWYYDNRPPHHG